VTEPDSSAAPLAGRESSAAERRTGILAGSGAYFLWGLFPLYFHALSEVSPWEVLAWRVTLSCALVAFVLWRQGKRFGAMFADARSVLRLALAGVALAVNWMLYIWAVGHDRVIDASLGYFVNPLLTVGLGVIVLHERLRVAQRVAVALGATAVLVLTVAYGQVPWISLVIAASFSCYTFLKKSVRYETVQSLFVETMPLVPLAAVGLLVAGIGGHLSMGSKGAGVSAMLAGLGVVTAVPLLLFGVATRFVELTTIGLLQYFTPVVQFLLGYLVFHESVPLPRWIGFALIWIALVALSADAVRSVGRTGSASRV
jgi:chloramphenicol-sensitive protein RarD